jgi:hypothetical protein
MSVHPKPLTAEFTIQGIPVVTSPLIPKVPVLALSVDCPVTDDFRVEMNKWLLDMFGARHRLYLFDPKRIGTAVYGSRVWLCHPEMYAQLKAGLLTEHALAIAGVAE